MDNIIGTFQQLESIIPDEVTDIVLVGGAEPCFNEEDRQFIASLEHPLFVYLNHGTSSGIVQSLYPKRYNEMLFVRMNTSGYFGIKEGGDLYFKPKSFGGFLGVLRINFTHKVDISDAYAVYSLSGDLYSKAREGYIADPVTGGDSPTTGFFVEKVFSEYLTHKTKDPEADANCFSKKLYVIGFGLDDSVPRYGAHNVDYEQQEQKEKLADGRLVRIGGIQRASVSLREREKGVSS